MRNAVTAFVLLMIMVLTGITINTIDNTTTRKNELDTNLSAAMEQSMLLLTVDTDSDYDIESKEDLIADFIQNFLIKTTTDSTFTIDIIGADAEKGLLDVKVTETFGSYAGIKKSVSVRKTIILEDYENEDNVYFDISFVVPDPEYPSDTSKQVVVKQTSIHGGDSLTYAAPSNPEKEGYKFVGWKCKALSDSLLFTDLSSVHALDHYTFIAVFEEI